MAIEPLGSVMSFQAQPAAKEQTSEKTAETMDGSASEVTKNVDATTASVKETAKSDEQGNDREDGSSSDKNSPEQIKKTVDQLNKKMNNTVAEFGIHEGTNRVTIKIVDKDTKKVIKEFPPEKALDMIAKAWELAGLLVDERR